MERIYWTDEETRTETYLEWDNANLGKAVKKLAKSISDHHGDDSTTLTACGSLMAAMVGARGAITAKISLDRVTKDGSELGDWEIVIRRKKRTK